MNLLKYTEYLYRVRRYISSKKELLLSYKLPKVHNSNNLYNIIVLIKVIDFSFIGVLDLYRDYYIIEILNIKYLIIIRVN